MCARSAWIGQWLRRVRRPCRAASARGTEAVVECSGQDRHSRLAVVFWKVSAGHSTQKRVRLLPLNLPVAQALHM